MRYSIISGTIVRSENAAKPFSQRSKHLHEYITSLPKVRSSFDLGCGKLRYAASILDVSDSLTLVDSEIQLARDQCLGRFGLASIRKVYETSNRVSCRNIGEFINEQREFDRGFCLNVLPIVPSERIRLHLVQLARHKLRLGCHCYFSAHYRNKEFRRMKEMSNSVPHADGFVIRGARGASFYAALSPKYLTDLIEGASFRVTAHKIVHGACYLQAEAI